MNSKTHPRREPGPFPTRQGIGLYLENEGGTRPDVRIWLLVASGLFLLGALSWGLRILLRLLVSF
jgi:hypothetical protein